MSINGKIFLTLTFIVSGVITMGVALNLPSQESKGKEKMRIEKVMVKGEILPVEATVYRLPNGLTFTFVPRESSGLFAYYTAMRVGSRDEVEKGHSGFAHLFEHMMFRGTKNLPGEVYDNEVAKMGADSSAWTWNDQTVYFFVAPSEKIGKVIEMEAERFKNLYYDEKDFKTESGAVLGEYNKNYSNPINKLEEALWNKAFVRHTYKHTTMGFIEDIKAMPTMYKYSLKFFRRHYRPENAYIFVVGNFDEEKALKLIEKNYGDWQRGSYKTAAPVEPPQNEERRVHIDWENPVLPLMLIGYKIPAFSTETTQSAALTLTGEMIFGKTGNLFKKLVLKEQTVERIRYWDWPQRDPGLFIVEVKLKKPNFDQIVREIDAEIEKVAGGNFSEEKLESVKSHYIYATVLSLDTARRLAEQFAFYSTLTGDPMCLDKFLQKVREVKKQEVIKVVKKYLIPDRRTIATLSHGERETKKTKGEGKK